MGKLDLEGAEPLALAGARALRIRHIRRFRCLNVLDEPLKRFGSSVAKARSWLNENGYDTVLYVPHEKVRPGP